MVDQNLAMRAMVVDGATGPLRNIQRELHNVSRSGAIGTLRNEFTALRSLSGGVASGLNMVAGALTATGLAAGGVIGSIISVSGALRNFSKNAAELRWLSAETKMTTMELMKLQKVGERLEIAPEATQQGVRAFSKNMFEMRNRISELRGSLGQRGAGEFAEKITELAKAGDHAGAWNLFVDALERLAKQDFQKAQALAEMMTGNAQFARFAQFKGILKELGPTIDYDVAAAERFNRQWFKFGEQVDGLKQRLGNALLDPLTDALDKINKLIDRMQAWYDKLAAIHKLVPFTSYGMMGRFSGNPEYGGVAPEGGAPAAPSSGGRTPLSGVWDRLFGPRGGGGGGADAPTRVSPRAVNPFRRTSSGGGGSVDEAGGAPATPADDGAGAGSGAEYLGRRREAFRREIEGNVDTKKLVGAILSAENPGAGTAVVESLFNRTELVNQNRASKGQAPLSIRDMIVGHPSIGGGKSFYGPMRTGAVNSHMRRMENDPAYAAKMYRLIERAYTANTILGHTDQGSAGDPNYIKGGIGVNINRERFNDWGYPGSREFRRKFQEGYENAQRQPRQDAFAGPAGNIEEHMRKVQGYRPFQAGENDTRPIGFINEALRRQNGMFEGKASISVDVNAPKGTKVTGQADGLFGPMQINRSMQMAPTPGTDPGPTSGATGAW